MRESNNLLFILKITSSDYNKYIKPFRFRCSAGTKCHEYYLQSMLLNQSFTEK